MSKETKNKKNVPIPQRTMKSLMEANPVDGKFVKKLFTNEKSILTKTNIRLEDLQYFRTAALSRFLSKGKIPKYFHKFLEDDVYVLRRAKAGWDSQSYSSYVAILMRGLDNRKYKQCKGKYGNYLRIVTKPPAEIVAYKFSKKPSPEQIKWFLDNKYIVEV